MTWTSARRLTLGRQLLVLAAFCAGLWTATTGAVEVANSEADWSATGTQGENNWEYGYFDVRADVETRNGAYNSADFIPFEASVWDGTKWDLLDNGAANAGPWTEVTQIGGHPAANGQTDTAVHWAIRRWTSTVAGDVEITGLLRNNSAGGDGDVGRILVNGVEIWSALSDGFDVNVRALATLAVGDLVDFAADPDGAGVLDPGDPATLDSINDGSDGFTFTVQINDEPTLVDPDGDGVDSFFDNCDDLANPNQTDTDEDGVGDACDNCPELANPDQANRDGDSRGDACDDPPIADSRVDWSSDGVQGENNWFNGYFNLTDDDNGSYQPGDFIPFVNAYGPEGGPIDFAGTKEPDMIENHWDGSQYDHSLDPANPWTVIGQEQTHPNTSGVLDQGNKEFWTIRRWMSTFDGAVTIAWDMRKQNTNGGDGVLGIVYVNGREVDRAAIGGTDGTGILRRVNAIVRSGEPVDLVLTPNGNDGSDGSFNGMTIHPIDEVPAGTTFGYILLVALLLLTGTLLLQRGRLLQPRRA